MQWGDYPQVLIGGCHVDSSRDVPTSARCCIFVNPRRYDVDLLVPDVHGVTVTVTVESQVRPSCLFHPPPWDWCLRHALLAQGTVSAKFMIRWVCSRLLEAVCLTALLSC
jgi:hypothetical protein